YEEAGPARHYYDREAGQSSYTAPTPSPYPPYPHYGSDTSYYGSGASQLFYDRATGQYYSPQAARQRGFYYDREAARWDYAPSTEAGAAGDSRVGPYPWGSPR